VSGIRLLCKCRDAEWLSTNGMIEQAGYDFFEKGEAE
jgi:hypothetical protein